MARKTPAVKIAVSENFFNLFEKERRREQLKLEKKIGRIKNLSQRNFSEMLARKGFGIDDLRPRPARRKRK